MTVFGIRSLSLRFALVVAGIGVIGAILATLALRAQIRHGFEQQVTSSASSVTELIRQATRAGMLHNRWDDVKETITNIRRQPEIVRIRLISKKGVVVFSSEAGEIGRSTSLTASECRACHVPGPPKADLPREERVRIFTDSAGKRVLGMIEPLPGEPACFESCHHHTPGQPVLGVIDTQLSLEAADALNARSTERLIGLALTVQLTAAAVIAVVFAWMWRRRMRPMLSAIQQLRAGDYRARIQVETGDELGHLAHSFNEMVEDLERSHAELQNWTRTLQERVEEKTRELSSAQDQMIRSERLAVLGRLAATVAHELNNPITGMQVFVRRARRRLGSEDPPPPPKLKEIGEWMEMVDRELVRCGRIVEDLLAFSRQRAPQAAPVQISDLVRRATRLLGHKLDLEEIDLELRLPDDIPTIVADGPQIEQALLAVLINAVEAMPSGGSLVLSAQRHPGGGIELRVQDSGIGIPPEVMPHIYEPFFSTKPEGQGTGLGLSVVYGIVSRHGGRLDVQSAPGQGTTVTLYFPPAPKSGGGDEAGAPAGNRGQE